MVNVTAIVYKNTCHDKYFLYDVKTKWERRLGKVIEMDKLIKTVVNISKPTIATKPHNFQYKLLLGVLSTNIQLKYWKIKQTNMCYFCQRSRNNDTFILAVFCNTKDQETSSQLYLWAYTKRKSAI